MDFDNDGNMIRKTSMR